MGLKRHEFRQPALDTRQCLIGHQSVQLDFAGRSPVERRLGAAAT
jgi:hypothetical protein